MTTQRPIQPDLFGETPMQAFEAWRQTPGGKHVMKHAYRLAACYAARYQRTGQRVSVALIWELLRDRVDWLKRGLKKRGVDLAKWNGFSFNNNFRAYAARHMMDHRREWAGLFELREVGKVREKRTVLVIKERQAA